MLIRPHVEVEVLLVQLEFPDSHWSIKASPDAKSPFVLAALVASVTNKVSSVTNCAWPKDSEMLAA